MCSALLECNVLTTDLRKYLSFAFRMLYIAIAVRSCIVKGKNKAQFPVSARALLIELKELSGSPKQYQALRDNLSIFLPKVMCDSANAASAQLHLFVL